MHLLWFRSCITKVELLAFWLRNGQTCESWNVREESCDVVGGRIAEVRSWCILWSNLKSTFPRRKLNQEPSSRIQFFFAQRYNSFDLNYISFFFLYRSSIHQNIPSRQSLYFLGIETLTFLFILSGRNWLPVPNTDTLTSAIHPIYLGMSTAKGKGRKEEEGRHRGEENADGRKHSARKSLNLHESQSFRFNARLPSTRLNVV